MTDSSPAPGGDLGTPAPGKLLKTLAITLAAAAVVFVVVILPAEYGIDPTRIGGLLGLDRLYEAAGTEPMAEAEEGLLAPMAGNRELRAETVTIEIGANEQMEYKLQMIEGMTIVYFWRTDGGAIYSDFHADPFNDLDDEPVRYAEEFDVTGGRGGLTAGYSGNHGWFWLNESDSPVTIELDVRGFFTNMREIGRAPAGTEHLDSEAYE